MDKKQTNRWKDYLLKSSLPLEQMVSEKLEKHKFYVSGEYTYSRTNEHEIETEFSVDLHAFDLLQLRGERWGNLNVLIECKYNYPGVEWVFSPHPKESLVIVDCIRCLEDLSTKRLRNKKPLYKIGHELQYCTRGIELNKSGADLNTIPRGLHQLRYALPNLVAQEHQAQATVWNEEDLVISLVCPILVTTASLHILKSDLGLEDYQSASSLGEVAEEVDALVVYQEPGSQLYRYCERVAQALHKQHPEIELRLDEFKRILEPTKQERVLPSTWALTKILPLLLTTSWSYASTR